MPRNIDTLSLEKRAWQVLSSFPYPDKEIVPFMTQESLTRAMVDRADQTIGFQRMEIIETFLNEVLGFLRISQAWEIVKAGDIRAFASADGIRALIVPIIPLLLIFELVLGLVHRNPQMKVYKVNFLIYVVNRFIGRFISLGMVVLCISLFQKHAPFQTTLTWYWFIYAYLVWELGHFIYHYLAHKVRLLWCLHSTHHAPEEMNLSVTHAHFFSGSTLCRPHTHVRLHTDGRAR